MNRKIFAIIILGLVLFASFLACGYFGVKAIRRTRLRHSAMTAYEKKDYILAERLLHAYVRQDPNAEAEYAALANIYREFGNAGMETQMWQTASSLNPLSQEYYHNMLTSAVRATNYSLLHAILERKIRVNENLSDYERYLYVIASYRTNSLKNGDDVYKKAVETDPEAFRKNDLGRMAEFMVKYPSLTEGERQEFLNDAMNSEDPTVRFEAVYTAMTRAAQSGEQDSDATVEKLLKRLVDINYFAGTPLLADFYFSKFRFGDLFDVLEPYLKTIDDMYLYLLYAESCVFEGKSDELKALKSKLRRKPASMEILSDYCDILIAYMDNDQEKLSSAIRQSGKIVNSPLSNFIHLRVALANDSFGEIRSVAQEIFSAPPFHDLHNRALVVCLDYLSFEMTKPENRKDPSQMAELAKILSGYLQGNPLLTEIILMDQYKKGLIKEEDLMAALEQFPDDALLLQVTAEYLILNGKAEKALEIIEPILASSEEADREPDRTIRFLYMLALDQLGRRDEASIVFQELIEQSEFDLDLLTEYFKFCEKNRRQADLASMADKLETVKDGELNHYGLFFRAASMLVTGDEARVNDALKMLVPAPTDDPEFTFYAATQLCEHDWLDEAEAKYKAILKTYRTPSLPYINLSNIYHEKKEDQKALEAAKEACSLETRSMLPAFIYAKRLSEAGRYEEAVNALNFPRRAVNYRDDVIRLWTDCMKKVIEKSIAEQRYLQAEEQCKHLLIIVPDDAEGMETLEKIREILSAQNKDRADAGGAPDA